MINLVSLGMSCQTTHQLDSYAGQYPEELAMVKGPFDWLICPPDSASAWLDAGLCDFQPGAITEHLQRAYWPQFGLWFWHGFIDRTGKRNTLDLAGLADNELSKLNYLREKFCNLDLVRTVFVLSNTQNNLDTEVYCPAERSAFEFTEKKVDRLQLSLDRFFASPVRLQLVTRPDRAESNLLQRPNVEVLPEDRSNWKGNKLEWSRVLHQLRH